MILVAGLVVFLLLVLALWLLSLPADKPAYARRSSTSRWSWRR